MMGSGDGRVDRCTLSPGFVPDPTKSATYELRRNMMESDCARDRQIGINLVDCGLEEVVTALLAAQPITGPSNDDPFILKNDDSRRILSYYVNRRDL